MRRIPWLVPLTLLLTLHPSPLGAAPKPLQQATDPPPKAAKPPQIGPFKLSTADGRFSVQPGFVGQIRVSVKNREGADGRETEGEVEFRRIRLLAKGTVLSKDLSWGLQLSLAPGSLEAADFFFNYRLHRWAELRLGQFKIPFTNLRFGSNTRLPLADWSMITKYFGAERQMGLAVHNGWGSPSGLEYHAGVFTGVNARSSHAVMLPRLFGEPTPNPSDLSDPAAPAAFHPELVFHLAYNTEAMNPRTHSDWTGGGLRLHAGLSATWDLNPEPFTDFEARMAAEVLVKAFGGALNAIGYLGLARGEADSFGETELGMYGVLLEASYLIRKRVELAARYAMARVAPELRRRAFERARRLIASASDDAAAAARTKQYGKAGDLVAEQEVGLGVNVYIVGNDLKWQSDGTLSFVEGEHSGSSTAFTFRTQLQLAF